MHSSSLLFAVLGWLVLMSQVHLNGAGNNSQKSDPIVSAGPPVGAAAPPFTGTDQFGQTQTLNSVMGTKGVMLVFFRSADW